MGHYAEVSFRWSYPSQEQPKLFILHNGRAISMSAMQKKTIKCAQNFNNDLLNEDSDYSSVNLSDDDEAQDHVYECKMVSTR